MYARSVDMNTRYDYIGSHQRRRVEQLAARRAHNPEVAGSSPAPAITRRSSGAAFFYCLTIFPRAGLEPEHPPSEPEEEATRKSPEGCAGARREAAGRGRTEGESCPCYNSPLFRSGFFYFLKISPRADGSPSVYTDRMTHFTWIDPNDPEYGRTR